MRSINLLRRVVISGLLVSMFGSVALWWLSAARTYVSGPHDCHGTMTVVPGWKVQYRQSPTRKLILYGQSGCLEAHLYWKDYSIDMDGAKLARKGIDFGGFKYKSLALGPNNSVSVFVPFWALVVILAAYPVTSFIRGPVMRWRRHRVGACLKCGYSLSGNSSGVCPECGTPARKDWPNRYPRQDSNL